MKKLVPVLTLVAAIAIGVSLPMANGFASEEDRYRAESMTDVSQSSPVASNNANQPIGTERAVEIASQRVDGTIESVELDDDDRRLYYEVQIKKDHVEYEIKVDAYTGEIIKIEIDDRDDRIAPDIPQDRSSIEQDKQDPQRAQPDRKNDQSVRVEQDDDHDDRQVTTRRSSLLTVAEAIAIAKQHVAGEVVEMDLDEDDGRYEYEIELRTARGEAEITIDASTGEVLELEHDDDDDGRDD